MGMIYNLVKISSSCLTFYILNHLIYQSTYLTSFFNTFGFIFLISCLSWHLAASIRKRMILASGPEVLPQGKCVLVTGCDTGFGHEIALRLNEDGFTVFAGCLYKDHSNAQSLLFKAKNPSKMILVSFDITREEDRNMVYKEIEEYSMKTGESFFALVNNAGVSGYSLFEWGTMENDIKPVIKINLESSILVTRTFIPLLIKTNGARIVNMSSYITHGSLPFVATYCVSKCGIKKFSEALRKDVEDDPAHYNGLKILTIEPAAHKTGILGYPHLKNTVKTTWERSTPEVKNAYGTFLFTATYTFISICEFFEAFDFVAFKRDLSEVIVGTSMALTRRLPHYDTELVSVFTRMTLYIGWGFYPQEFIESCFMVVAYILFIFAFEVAFVRKIFNIM